MRCLTNCREIRSKIAERLPAETRSDLWSYEDFAVAFERASDGLTAEAGEGPAFIPAARLIKSDFRIGRKNRRWVACWHGAAAGVLAMRQPQRRLRREREPA